jgi:hypothetical protein
MRLQLPRYAVIVSGGLNILLSHNENIVIPFVTMIVLAEGMTWKRQSNPTSGPQNNTKIVITTT